MRASAFLSLAWAAAGLLLVLSFWLDFFYVQQGGAIDLRNRVTGTRLLVHHIDPYFYKWREPAPPQYCDPYNNPHLPVSKTTASPASLLLELPVAVLPYRLGEFAWLALQWVFLLGTAWIWLRLCETDRQRLLLVIFVTGFTYTAEWRLHAERGQSYVLLLFFFALWLAETFRPRLAHPFWAGLLAGFLAALRPPFLLLAPFLLFHRRNQLAGACAGLLLGLALPMLWQGNCWLKYASAMHVHGEVYLANIDPAPGPGMFPSVIENLPTDLIANYVAIPYADFSLDALLRKLGHPPFRAGFQLLAFLTAYGAWLIWSRRQSLQQLLAGVAAWLFLVDLFLPAYRNIYNDVLIVNLVALGLISFARAPWAVGPCFLALPIGWGVFVFTPMHDWLIVLPSFLFALGAGLLIFWFHGSGPSRQA